MGTSIMQKTGQVERTIDREFAEEEGRYRTYVWFTYVGYDLISRMEKETNNLQKEAKTYLDAMRGMLFA
jgi:hypothetical protein